jgi:UDPglucose 6-dehydrogenase
MDRYFGKNLKLSVVGLGKLGSPLAAAFASKGFEVVGCDIDEDKVRAINEGRAPVDETDLQKLITAHCEKLKATQSIAEAVRFADITFVATATPSGPDNRFSLEYVLPVCEEIGQALRTKSKQAFHIVVITSTVMPGDTWGPIRETIEKHSGRKCGESFGLAYSPEFIALGSVLRDFLNPDFVLLGASDPLTEARVTSVYKTISDAPIAAMSPVNAEITKIAVNTFLCTKISYANMLLRICNEIPGADVDVVSGAVGMDSRIGKKLLKGGVSYGGPCLPRDTKAMATLGQSFPLVIDAFNRAQIDWLARTVKKIAGDERVVVIGTSYKPGTTVETESPGLALLSRFQELYPGNSKPDRAKVVVIMQPEPVTKDAASSGMFENMTVIDPWRFLPELANDSTVNYIPLGIGPRE